MLYNQGKIDVEPIRKGVSLLDDASSVNNTSDGETFASDDPFSLLHELHVTSKLEDSVFSTSDESSRPRTNSRSWSTGGSTYEETPFMTPPRMELREGPEASLDIFNIDKKSLEHVLPTFSSPKPDGREKDAKNGDSEKFSTDPPVLLNKGSEPKEQHSTSSEGKDVDTFDEFYKRNYGNCCEIYVATHAMVHKTGEQIEGCATVFFRDKNVVHAFVLVKNAFGFCYDQVDGILTPFFKPESNPSGDENMKLHTIVINGNNHESRYTDYGNNQTHTLPNVDDSKTQKEKLIQHNDRVKEPVSITGNNANNKETTGPRELSRNVKEDDRNDESIRAPSQAYYNQTYETGRTTTRGSVESIQNRETANGEGELFPKKTSIGGLISNDSSNNDNGDKKQHLTKDDNSRVPMLKRRYNLQQKLRRNSLLVGHLRGILGKEKIDSSIAKGPGDSSSFPYSRTSTTGSRQLLGNDLDRKIMVTKRSSQQAKTNGNSETPIDLTMMEDTF